MKEYRLQDLLRVLSLTDLYGVGLRFDDQSGLSKATTPMARGMIDGARDRIRSFYFVPPVKRRYKIF